MKHDCDIVRDLMPMCIDGTASDKAKDMVEEHVAECSPCDKVYGEMKGEARLELPVQTAAPEFVTTVKKMQQHRKRRTWLTLLLGVMITAAVALAGFYGYYWYFEDQHPLEDAQLTLVASKDGIALIHAANVPKSATMYIHFSAMTHPESAQGQYEGCVYLYATRHEARTNADDVYFIIGNVEEDAVISTDMWGGDVQVYRMLLGRQDGSGQVFYLANEEQLQEMSIKGAHLKSPEVKNVLSGDAAYYDRYAYDLLTPTPRPYTEVEYVEIYAAQSTLVPMSTGEYATWIPAKSTPSPTPMAAVYDSSNHDGPVTAFITEATASPVTTATPAVAP